MRKSRILPVLALAFFSACTSANIRRLLIEMPRPSSIRLDAYQELLISDFLVKKEVSGFALNKELTDYFKAEWEKKFKGKVALAKAAPAREEDFKAAEVWKTMAGNSSRAVVMTGQVAFSQEARKALLEKEPGWKEGYFSAQNILSERLIFTLEVNIFFIRGETGDILFQRDYKETRTYKSMKQPADFAFFELIQTAKQKLFSSILGDERFQERYLISK